MVKTLKCPKCGKVTTSINEGTKPIHCPYCMQKGDLIFMVEDVNECPINHGDGLFVKPTQPKEG